MVFSPMRPLGSKRFLALFAGLGFLAGAALSSVPAMAGADPGLDLLQRASKYYDAGDYTDSAQMIEAAFKAGLTGEYAARAILLRAQINEAHGSLALALQDYSNAMWVGSLADAEKKKAAQGKERVMAAMGLGSEPAAAAPRQTPAPQAKPAPPAQQQSPGGALSLLGGMFGGNDEKREAPAEQPKPQKRAEAAPAQQQQQQSSSSGVFGFFGGMFGGGDEKREAPAEQPKPQKRAEAAPAQQQQSSSGGVFGFFGGMFGGGDEKREAPAGQTPQAGAELQAAAKPAKAEKKPVKAASALKPAPAPAPASVRLASAKPVLQPASALAVASAPDGAFIVFGATPSEASGRATAQQIKTQLSDILVNRQLDVAMRAGGGYQIQAGPYKAKSAALALCSAIKQRGVPCQVTP
jgi:hypothetical protein